MPDLAVVVIDLFIISSRSSTSAHAASTTPVSPSRYYYPRGRPIRHADSRFPNDFTVPLTRLINAVRVSTKTPSPRQQQVTMVSLAPLIHRMQPIHIQCLQLRQQFAHPPCSLFLIIFPEIHFNCPARLATITSMPEQVQQLAIPLIGVPVSDHHPWFGQPLYASKMARALVSIFLLQATIAWPRVRTQYELLFPIA